MRHTLRWYGSNDPILLANARHAGATGIVTSLSHLKNGQVWEIDEILKRKNEIEQAGLTFSVVENFPVHEDIKKQSGHYLKYIENYKQSIKNLANCGVYIACYNFMPILDWPRTDLLYEMSDGSKTFVFDVNKFAAFDLFILKRPGAENNYTSKQKAEAKHAFERLTDSDKLKLQQNIIASLCSTNQSYSIEDFLKDIQGYVGIDTNKLRENLLYFLREIIPVAQSVGVKMAIHPDNPPFPILGLPRVVSSESDLELLLNAIDSPSNGFCMCTGTYGVSAENDVPGIIDRHGEKMNFIQLTNIQRYEEGNFYEVNHLDGNVDMYEVIKSILKIEQKTKRIIPMHPDYGRQISDNLKTETNFGSSEINPLRGLAELRGLELGIKRSLQTTIPSKIAL